jgi:hypothetical protein
MPSVLAGDEISLAKNANGTVGDVFKVADRGGDKVQHTGPGLNGL